MHMADALLSPAVGGAFWAATAATIALSSKKVRDELDDRKVPLMGVLGAFIFAVQMINFTIPGTGSSGHLGGGMILAVLLGPHAAFIVLASVLCVQALFFADGGLLALGCNAFNLGIFSCFLAYPLIFRPIAGNCRSSRRVTVASILSAVVALQLGALFVVLETVLSGVSDLPFDSFLFMMQPIHLVIGLVEGLVTAAVVGFVLRMEPEILRPTEMARAGKGRKAWAALLAAAFLVGGGLSLFASRNPDGLEWAISKVAGEERMAMRHDGVHAALADLQGKSAILPDYDFEGGTGVAGLVGGLLCLVAGGGVALLLRKRRRKR